MKKFLAILLVLALALTGMALAEAAPEESGVVLYTSDLGYTMGLPDESWFNLNAETYAQYADDPAFSTIFSFLNISTENIDEVTASMDYFYTTDSGANINVQVLPAISDEDYEMTLSALQPMYEQMGATDYAEGQIAIGDWTYDGCECTVLGQWQTLLYLRTESATYILTFTQVDSQTIVDMLTPATFA